MPFRPHLVLADDLTGAAEIAAIAHDAGLRAVVLTHLPTVPVAADLLVFDTDTRLLAPEAAARKVRAWAKCLAHTPHRGFFLKVDSVLRGSVLAHATATARALGRHRTLLVPANPSLGRTIRAGRYAVKGVPLHETAFARDPHHPRTSDHVVELLGRVPRTPVVSLPPATDRLPNRGVAVGDTSTPADVRHWVDTLDSATLPAGGADFFRAWLTSQGPARQAKVRSPSIAGPALLLHGSAMATDGSRLLRFRGKKAPAAAAVAAALARHGAVAVAPPSTRLTGRDAPAALARGFADLAWRLHTDRSFTHLLIAGGATAAAVLPMLGWTDLEVIRAWGPGAVTLRPVRDPAFAVTLKPGSYDWPATLRRALPAGLFD
jgi:uncharacterized protein YgbK (DUF1537 family)